MATTTVHRPPTTDTVVEPVDEDGARILHERASGTAYHVVDYADAVLREKLAARDVGETVRLDLVPADPDGLDWIATRPCPGAPATPGGAW